MATHSSILAWKIKWTEEPGGLQSMGSQKVGHDLATKQEQLKEKLLFLGVFTVGDENVSIYCRKQQLHFPPVCETLVIFMENINNVTAGRSVYWCSH